MGKGSRGKKFRQIQRTKREKRLKERYGEHWNDLHYRNLSKFSIDSQRIVDNSETEPTSSLKEEPTYSRTRQFGSPLFDGGEYFTPENTTTKRGRMPDLVPIEDIPTYLANYCVKNAKGKPEDGFCYDECKIRTYCEGTEPGTYNFESNKIVDAFRELHPDKEINLVR